MSSEQQDGSSYHFNTTNDERKQKGPSFAKPSWQVARDISMEILSRKSTKLTLKQGVYDNFSYLSIVFSLRFSYS